MRIVLATFPTAEYQGLVMTQEGARNRLISYVFARELKDGQLEEYKTVGLLKEGKRSQK